MNKGFTICSQVNYPIGARSILQLSDTEEKMILSDIAQKVITYFSNSFGTDIFEYLIYDDLIDLRRSENE